MDYITPIKEEKLRQFVLDTLLPYKEDPQTCGYEHGSCCYLTDNGKMCALGKHMNPGPWQDSLNDAEMVLLEYGKEEVLTEEALSYNIDEEGWRLIQLYHDSIAVGHSRAIRGTNVDLIETHFNLKFPELRYD